MPRQKAKHRQFKIIAFKAYYDTDQGILDWWESIEDGERSEELRDVLRDFIGLQPQRKSKVIHLPELTEVRRDTLWIKDTLNDMPAYLERIMQDATRNWQPTIVSQTQARASPEDIQSSDPALTDSESQRRTRRMRNATW